MNLGDGLLFELENGKPKLILLRHGVEKNPAKQPSFKHRAANVLSSRQPSCVEEAQGEERPARQQTGRHGETKSKAGAAVTSFTPNTSTTGRRSAALTSSRAHERHKVGSGKAAAKVKSDRHKRLTTVGSLRANGNTGQPQNSGTQANEKEGPKGTLATGDAALKDSVACLTNQQLQWILHTVQTSSNGQHPPEDPSTQGNQTDKNSGFAMNDDGGGGGGGGGGGEEGKEMKEEDRGGGADTTGRSNDKDSRSSGFPFSWLEERQSDSRAAINAKKAQWRRELDEQVALKQQQRSSPGRLQAEEDTESVFSVLRSVNHKDQPSAIRFSLRLGEVTPIEEVLNVERREEQRRRWLEELDRQREETSERRRQEKVLQSQTEDHELWATHFDSLQRRPPVHTVAPPAPSAPPPAPSSSSEPGEWEPSSSLSLVWEATSSCGAESVGGASIDKTSGYPARASYLRTMTALLDPTQIEERERRRLKQLEQQRAIEAQVEERRWQREREEARRREEEEEEERRVVLEQEMLERRYKLDMMKERQKLSQQAEPPKKSHDDDNNDNGGEQEAQVPIVTRQGECLEEQEVSKSPSTYRDIAVQTEAAPSSLLLRVQTPDVSAQYQPPPTLSAAPPKSRNPEVRTGKENVCLPGGGGRGRGAGIAGEPHEALPKTDRSRRDKRRPEWNTQRTGHQFVPASGHYPASLQRNRQESRQRRQAELLALQERTHLSRTDPPPPTTTTTTKHQKHHLRSTRTITSPIRRVESVSRGQGIAPAINTERGRSPPVPALRHRGESQQTPPSSVPTPALPVLEFVPYVRTDEVFRLDPLEPADTPPPHTHTEAPQSSSASPPAPSHRHLYPEPPRNTQTHRQQEILRGLAQLRQGLLQKQRELETDLNPLLKHHNDNERRLPSATHRR